MGLHRHRRHRQQLGGDIAPDRRQQDRARALALGDRGDEAALAHQAVLDVFGQLRRRVGDPGAVPRGDQVEVLRLQEGERIHVGGEGAAAGRDDGRAEAEDEVAGEADAAGEEGDVVGRVPGRRHRQQAEVLLAVLGEDDLDLQLLGARRVVGVGMGQQHAPDPAPLDPGGADRIEVPGVLGAGVDDDAGVGADEVGVGPFQGHRPRVGCDDLGDLRVARGELGQPATSLAIASRASSGSSTTRSPAPRRISRTSQGLPA